MIIHSKFTGGNISILSQNENEVFLDSDMRDSTGTWFYWAFCVEGAAGTTLRFHFPKTRIGYWGPAVSTDLKEWHWLHETAETSFTYHFSEQENRVYFAHHMLYPVERFTALAERHGLSIGALCQSRKGRSVPCLRFGEGEQTLILTARHHACESTGSYVLEGVLDELISSPPKNLRVLCVPFVDYDGVIDGDQGKNRAPHDHNRDYLDAPLYPEVAAILAFANQYGCHLGFDFHSPYHKGHEHDTIFIVRNREDRIAEFDRFSSLLERECNADTMLYRTENDLAPNEKWNKQSEPITFGRAMHSRPECRLAFSLESTYFGTEENRTEVKRLISLGKAFARAIKKYWEEEK